MGLIHYSLEVHSQPKPGTLSEGGRGLRFVGAVGVGLVGALVSPAIAAGATALLALRSRGRSRSRGTIQMAILLAAFGVAVAGIALLQGRARVAVALFMPPVAVAGMFLLTSTERRTLVLGLATYLCAFGIAGVVTEAQLSHSALISGKVLLPRLSKMGWLLSVSNGAVSTPIGQVWIAREGTADWTASFDARVAAIATAGDTKSSRDSSTTGPRNANRPSDASAGGPPLPVRRATVGLLASQVVVSRSGGRQGGEAPDTTRSLLQPQTDIGRSGHRLAHATQLDCVCEGRALCCDSASAAQDTIFSGKPSDQAAVLEQASSNRLALAASSSIATRALRGSATIVVDGQPAGTRQIPLTRSWRHHDLTFVVPKNTRRVWLQLSLPSDATTQLAALRVRAGQHAARAAGTTTRISGPYADSNLAGHSAAMAAVAAIAASPNPVVWGLAFFLGLAGAWMTGSRAALIVLLIFGLLAVARHAFRAGRTHRLQMLLGLLAASILACLLLVSGTFIRPFLRSTDTSRPMRIEVYQADLDAIARLPWAGNGGDAGAKVSALLPRGATPVTHAHNLILQYGVVEGYPGLAAAALLVIGLIMVSVRISGAMGLVVALSALALNMVDYTFWSVGVYVPLATFLTSRNAHLEHRRLRDPDRVR